MSMKSRNNRQSKAGSTYAAEAIEEFTAVAGASGHPQSGTAARQVVPLLSGRASPMTTRLSHEQIAERAKAIWLASGCVPGRDEQNWREAEAQLRAELHSGLTP
jgi:hypothetical protein